LTLLFALHLLCVNVASAAPLVAVLFDWLEGRGNRLAGAAGRYLSWWGLALLIPGGLLGVAVGWQLWSSDYREVLSRLSSKVNFGAWELVFSLVLMLVHVLWWRARPQARGWERGLRMFVAMLASTNLLYHFPTLFAVIETTVTGDTPDGGPITSSEFRSIIARPALLARVLHFILAAIAMCGVMLLGYALRLMKNKAEPSDVQRVAAWGGQIALVPTLAQLPVGLWLAASLDAPLQSAVSGGDMICTALLLLSIAGSIWLMQTLAGIAIGDAERARMIKAMALIVLVVTMMSGVLQRLRAIALKASQPTASAQAGGELRWRHAWFVTNSGGSPAASAARGERAIVAADGRGSRGVAGARAGDGDVVRRLDDLTELADGGRARGAAGAGDVAAVAADAL
jgi:hypothetical protein